MANQVAARLAGDDYQHLVAWLALLELLDPASQLESVTVEDADAGSVDDVTKRYAASAGLPDQYIQVKYHVDHRSQYSTDVFLDASGKSRSLLRKFYDSWIGLRQRGRTVELELKTNWTWDARDRVQGCIRGSDNALSDDFFLASPQSDIGKLRQRWIDHLGIADEDFRQFATSLRLRFGYDCADELERHVAERMKHRGLRHDRGALHTSAGIVRDLIKAHRTALSCTDVEALIDAYSLRLAPPDDEPAAVVYLVTIKEQVFDVNPDFMLDWRRHFEGDAQKRSHRVLDPASWNDRMLPELRELEHRLNTTSVSRLLRARGLARLSAWFAFGYTFAEVARYTIEIDQTGQLWRTDATPSDLRMEIAGQEAIADGDAESVAAGISVAGSLESDVRAHVKATREAAAVLFLQPNRELGRGCFSSASDVAAFARGTKEQLRAFVKAHRARRLSLYYCGPISGACFLGHQLNAVASEIQIMEDQQPGYARAFLLA